MTDRDLIEWLMSENLLREMPLATDHWKPPYWILRGDGKGPRLLLGTTLRDPFLHREFIITAWLQ